MEYTFTDEAKNDGACKQMPKCVLFFLFKALNKI